MSDRPQYHQQARKQLARPKHRATAEEANTKSEGAILREIMIRHETKRRSKRENPETYQEVPQSISHDAHS